MGLFLLAIADSGERKSTCDAMFSQAIREYQMAQREAARPLITDYQADLAGWEAQCLGIRDQIRQQAKSGKPVGDLQARLRDLEQMKPQPPRVPHLLYEDATPEALGQCLATEWPSGSVVSAEAGAVFGSHAMSGDSIVRTLSLYNVLWDGGSMDVQRRTAGSYTLQAARLTVGLQVQDATLRHFLEKMGHLARGTGFLARFLISWPGSTQGQRLYVEPPAGWPSLDAYNSRITELLERPAPVDEKGRLVPTTLSLSPEAKADWIAFHNAIEGDLAIGGTFREVRDVASKIADNAARLAALFHVYAHGVSGAIGQDEMARACQIAAWHLSESRRFFGEIALPDGLADAVRLEDWIVDYCRQQGLVSVPKNNVRQRGPLRDGGRLDRAIQELVALDRLKCVQEGRRLTLSLNPAVLQRP